jgi:hypothetical protein
MLIKCAICISEDNMRAPSPLTDPIVEILRLAYRRGRALLQEQASKVDQVQSQSGSVSDMEADEDSEKFPAGKQNGIPS